jgi:hypothetical protein
MKWNSTSIRSIFLLSLLLITPSLSAQIFVAPGGDDSGDGSFATPLETIPEAISRAAKGDTIYLRGGNYDLTSRITIGTDKNGEENSRYYMFAWQAERPLLDFSNQALGSLGISLKASYWYIYGIDIKGAGDNGLYIDGGSNNIIEFCSFYENRDTGLQLAHGAADNRIINCDSYYNADPPDYGDADGFAPKLTVGSGNYFYGCRAWGNCDDGWDGYLRDADDVTTTLENCWTWGNGYFKDGSDPGPQANGNGFKMGGGDNSNSLDLRHHMNLTNCLAFENKNKGFDQNNNAGSMTLLNCTGFDNITADYRIKRELKAGETLVVKNCVAYLGAAELGDFAIQEANSWLPGFDVSDLDFVSINSENADAPRNPDGTLPDIEFMQLAQGSDLIDAGVDVGLPFNGLAPDLGAFESDFASAILRAHIIPVTTELGQNYPNPFNPVTSIGYRLSAISHVDLSIYTIQGRLIKTLVSDKQPAGSYQVEWDASSVASGVYVYRLQAEGKILNKKMMLLK